MSHCPTCKKLMRGICRYCQPQEYIDMMGKAFTELSDFYAKSRQQRTWVGLTDKEWSDLYEDHHNKYDLPKQGSPDGMDYERAIEAKLKAKNEQLEKNT